MQKRNELSSPRKLLGVLRNLAVLAITVALLGLVLMFSAVLLTALAIVGAIAWAYLWWRTRSLRKQMREVHARAMRQEAMAGNDAVFEGEVIRVVDPRDGR